ncbi:TetR/AcrR family transcriptional regulator [Frankia nepalensis]|nr:TetR/AcrR family transcriptional regulator C-terminal domain-containing protein [Frankia nepalensis]
MAGGARAGDRAPGGEGATRPAGGPPPALDLLWGAPAPPRRGPKPALRLDDLVGAAVALADEEGLSALSMGRVAERLGFATMSLYRHVASKDDLLLLMLNTAVGPPPAELDDLGAAGWRDGLDRWTRGMYERALAHPWINRISHAGAPTLPNQVAWMDRGVAPLAGVPLTGQEKLSTILALSIYAMAAAQLTTDIAAAADARAAQGTSESDYGAVLARLLDAERFPALHAIAASGEIEPSPSPSGNSVAEELHGEFHFGLARLLDGVEALLRSRAAPTGPARAGGRAT